MKASIMNGTSGVGYTVVARRPWSWSFSPVTLMAWLVYVFLLFPTLIAIPLSFGNPNEIVFPPQEFSLELYRIFFTTSNWLTTTMQSVKIAIVAAALALVLGALGSYGIARSAIPGKQVLFTLLMSPLLIPGVVTGLGLYSYFAYVGLIGSNASLVIGHAVLLCPFVIVTVSSGVRELDGNIETAASVMGSGRLRIYLKIVLPQLGPSLLGAGLFAFLMSFDELVIAWFISGANTMTLPVKMYSSVQTETSPVLAAVSTLLTLISLIIYITAESFRRNAVRRVKNKKGFWS